MIWVYRIVLPPALFLYGIYCLCTRRRPMTTYAPGDPRPNLFSEGSHVS